MFKKILVALATTTLVASPIVTAQAQAQSYGPQHRQVETRKVVQHRANGRTVVKKQTVVRRDTGRRWAKGQRFDRRYATNYRVVNNYRDYRLSAPPRGYHWVRSGNDAVLIAITSGLIGAVVGSAIR
ncbi:RcnB family protein [Sphingobium sp. CR2-8]|uniref:RcnB family protein n=1 Tax=Sphingobium sp. CR2-8 TaxID=1306534 RepID=UPI002DBD319B|nr:RcnB family protein [Sphingobium sp. CR2-8]MEC3910763.1 RcnB family protein [Sphingobium sp. CR2-8]